MSEHRIIKLTGNMVTIPIDPATGEATVEADPPNLGGPERQAETLSLRERLALGHAMTALYMSRQWSQDMGFSHRVPEDEDAILVINEMLRGTYFYSHEPLKNTARNSWPNVPQ